MPSARGSPRWLATSGEIVAALDAVLRRQIEQEVLTGLERHLETPFRIGPDRVAQPVAAGGNLLELVVAAAIGPKLTEVRLRGGVRETDQKDLVARQRGRGLPR